MPYSTKGRIHYVLKGIESSTLEHGQTVAVDKVVGVAIKQKAPDVTKGIVALSTIEKKEGFAVLIKGVVQVPAVASTAKGELLYIKSDNTLTKTASENTVFGKIVEMAGERGTPTGKVRVDLDQKA